MTPEEALTIYHAGPDVVVKVLCQLSNQVELLQKQVTELQKEVQRLKNQLAKNSRNSSKPPHLTVSKNPLQKVCGYKVNVNRADKKAIWDLHSRWWTKPTTQLFILLINASIVVIALPMKYPLTLKEGRYSISLPSRWRSLNIRLKSSIAPIAGTSIKQRFPNRSRPRYNMAPDLKQLQFISGNINSCLITVPGSYFVTCSQ